jgi:hypothetical protein
MLARFLSGDLMRPLLNEASNESGIVLAILLPFSVESAFVRLRVTCFFMFNDSEIIFILNSVAEVGFALFVFDKLF